jgi:hypothetical protein
MRKRAVVALLLSCHALGSSCHPLGSAALIRMAGPAAAIMDARRRSAELRVGMSEAEVEAVLGTAAG